MANETQVLSDRPSLGFEYEISLALMDTANVNFQFNETVVSYEGTLAALISTLIADDFEGLVIAKNIRLAPPTSAMKPVRNGYNPAAQWIPTASSVGSLGFEIYDIATTSRMLYYQGLPCVAKVVTKLDNATVRTIYCLYWTPRINIASHTMEDVGECTVEGEFSILAT